MEDKLRYLCYRHIIILIIFIIGNMYVNKYVELNYYCINKYNYEDQLNHNKLTECTTYGSLFSDVKKEECKKLNDLCYIQSKEGTFKCMGHEVKININDFCKDYEIESYNKVVFWQYILHILIWISIIGIMALGLELFIIETSR